ncbi:MAG: glycosyltransferase [Patescibacteria group bacterium]
MKKKIIYLTHWRFPSEKTMTPLVMKTCESFIQEGFSVELWIPQRPSGFDNVDPFIKHGISERFPIRFLPIFGSINKFGRMGFILMVLTFNISAFICLLKERKYNSPIIIYGHDIRDFIFPSFLKLSLFVEIHDFYESGFHFINKLVLKKTSGLIVTNRFKQKAIEARYGFPMNRMIFQPNAVSFEMFDIPISKNEARKKLGLPLNIKIILYTGHLFSWKGVDTLAKASSYLPNDTYIYFVGGTEEDRETLKLFVEDNKLLRIVFIKHQEHVDIPFFLKSADILVLPNTAKENASKYETSPVKLFEYMASGVPIVASSIPSIHEIVSSNEVFFFTPDDPKNLSEIIMEAINNENKTKKCIEASKVLARRFSWSSRAKSITALINKYT